MSWLLSRTLPSFVLPFVVLPALFLLALQPEAQAQVVVPDDDPSARWGAATWVEDAGFVAINSVLSGVGAGLVQWVDGGSFKDGFTRGALGGAVLFAGKRLAAERFDGAGLAGRVVGAAGSSMIRNASLGAPLDSALTVPVGPLWLHFARGESMAVRVDAEALYWIGYGVVEERLELDWGRTWSAGAPVFLVEGAALGEHAGERAGGLYTGGMIAINGSPLGAIDDVASHERIHMLQRDHYDIVFGHRLEAAAVGWLRGQWEGVGKAVQATEPWVYWGVGKAPFALWVLAWDQTDRENRWAEMEADYFQVRSR